MPEKKCERNAKADKKLLEEGASESPTIVKIGMDEAVGRFVCH